MMDRGHTDTMSLPVGHRVAVFIQGNRFSIVIFHRKEDLAAPGLQVDMEKAFILILGF